MSASIFNSELSNIIQDSKKKFPDIKIIAEKSVQELKSLPSTSEAQFAADFRRRPHLVDPLVAACKSKAPKLALPAVTCLQRLIVIDGLAPERLQDVLNALQDCVLTGNEVQLKILQSLPLLLQRHGDDLQGSSQAAIVQICLVLQQLKAPVISNTASATLSQVISLLFEKLEREDKRAGSIPAVAHISVGSIKTSVRPAAYDAYRIFQDICLMTRGHQTQFLRKATLSPNTGLELIESILGSHSSLFETHSELASILQSQVLPLVDTVLSERQGFQVTVRAIRVLCLLLQYHLHIIEADIDGTLGDFNYVLEHEQQNSWRRVLYMEALRIFYSSSNLVLNLFALLDQDKRRSNFVQENLAFFVHLVAERPALLGVGQHSALPTNPINIKASSPENDVTETSSAITLVGNDFGVPTINVLGLSTQYSMLKTPCLEQVDKAEAPQIPETYVHSLSLLCITALTEALAKVVLPLTVDRQARSRGGPKAQTADTPVGQELKNDSPADRSPSPNLLKQSQNRDTLVNPLELEGHPSHATVRTAAFLIESCWPPVLATCSTLLYAALDSEFYRTLIRAIQKFTQVSGLLRLSTPRDALLTTLSKAAVPSNLYQSGIATPSTAVGTPKLMSSPSFDSASTPTVANPQSHARRASLDSSKPALTQRNLICLRALVNLAIALGPILDGSWNIVLECLQRAHFLLMLSETTNNARDYKGQSDERHTYDGSNQPSLGSETAAVESAVLRLFQSTKGYSDQALSELLATLRVMLFPQPYDSSMESTTNTMSLRKWPSASHGSTISLGRPQDSQFLIARMDEIARVNIERLCTTTDPEMWHEILGVLMDFATVPNHEPTSRIMAAEVIASVCTNTILFAREYDDTMRRNVQNRAIGALHAQVCRLYERETNIMNPVTVNDIDVHRIALEAVRSILERAGDFVVTGWKVMLEMVETAFEPDALSEDNSDSKDSTLQKKLSGNLRSLRLANPAFSSVQLICSEFLESAFHRVSDLLKTLQKFAAQKPDLNMSLTTLTLISNVSDYLQTQIRAEVSLNLNEIRNKENEHKESHRNIKPLRQDMLSRHWVSCIESLADLVLDERADVRNGSIHTLFRALDGADIDGPLEGVPLLQVVLQMLVRNLLRVILSHVTEISQAAESQHETLNGILSSASVALTSFTSFVVLHLKEITHLACFEDFWASVVDTFGEFVELNKTVLTSTVFRCLSQLLSAVQAPITLSRRALDKAGSLWSFGTRYRSSAEIAELSAEDLNNAQLAFVENGQEIYRLTRSFIEEEQLKSIVDNLYQCLVYSKLVRYESDVHTMTKLQSEVLAMYNTLQIEKPGIRSRIMSNLARIVKFPFELESWSERPSFIALAKAGINVLQEVLVQSIVDVQIDALEDVAIALDVFVNIVDRRHDFKSQGKRPFMWQLSLNAVDSVLSAVSIMLKQAGARASVPATIWQNCVRLAGIVQDTERETSLHYDTTTADEQFDLDFIDRLRSFLTPALQDLDMPRQIREDYLLSLFTGSIVYHGQYNMYLGHAELLSSSLSNIYNHTTGYVTELKLKSRLRMCYECMDELFRLASTNQAKWQQEAENTEMGALGQVAFYLCVQRAALALNMFIGNQPLRGRMPAPMSQRNELLEILDHLSEMRCYSATRVDLNTHQTSGANEHELTATAEPGPKLVALDSSLRHLDFLSPLIHKAYRLTSHDHELREQLGLVLDLMVGVNDTS